jgi:dihydroflavonol-4-reductase
MKVLLTGADGLLGSNIARELLHQGYEVKVFLLPETTSPTLKELPVERVYGNLLDAEAVRQVMRGCGAVIHAAAHTGVWPVRSELVRRVNINGARHVFDAALAEDVSRVVHISSASSFGFGTKEAPGTEESPFQGARYGLDYIDSKHQAQELALGYAHERSLPVIVINPTFMFGPYDARPSAGRMILSVYEGKVPGYTRGGRNFAHARDVAKAAVNALRLGRVGECYIAGSQNLNYQEIFGKMSEVLSVRPPRIAMPNWGILTVGALGSLSGKLLGKEPVLSLQTARIALDGQYYSPAKAIRELEMPQTPIETAIQESFAWHQANGYVK